ncbi:MAG: hypothetical protein JWP31_852 [Aeromicrobium sp.]|nr:hypothetical protein [Aeromicrobium sp.]
MKISFDLPWKAVKRWDTWIAGSDVRELAATIESAGLHGVGMPDHPMPPDHWLASGGHQAFDPFVMLATIAAHTSRIRLHTNLIVAGYRSPYILAKSAASLDKLSGGRLTLGMGAGYVKSEFDAVGADFGGRGPHFDRSIAALREAWSGEEFEVPGITSEDGGRRAFLTLPRPEQPSGPPIWIGGNSKRARRRAAELGDGWMPLEQGSAQADVTGTDTLSGIAQLSGRIAELQEMRSALGKDGPFDVCLFVQDTGSPEQLRRFLDESGAEAEAAGVTWLTWQSAARSVGQCLEDIAQVGEGLTPG